MEYLSNIELYYTPPEGFSGNKVILQGEDFHHVTKVMRHKSGDTVYVTNGKGKIVRCEMTGLNKDFADLVIKEEHVYDNKFEKIFFCIPKLKSSDRFEFAIEKCVELGITNFIIYDADRAVAKGSRTERWNKIALAAMKQSLRSFLPKIISGGTVNDIVSRIGKKYIFEQNTNNRFNRENVVYDTDSYFVFGPEGGLSENELVAFDAGEKYNLTDNRLRSETAIIICASRL